MVISQWQVKLSEFKVQSTQCTELAFIQRTISKSNHHLNQFAACHLTFSITIFTPPPSLCKAQRREWCLKFTPRPRTCAINSLFGWPMSTRVEITTYGFGKWNCLPQICISRLLWVIDERLAERKGCVFKLVLLPEAQRNASQRLLRRHQSRGWILMRREHDAFYNRLRARTKKTD